MRWILTLVAVLSLLASAPFSGGDVATNPDAEIVQIGQSAIDLYPAAQKRCDGCVEVGPISECAGAPCVTTVLSQAIAQQISLPPVQATAWYVLATMTPGLNPGPTPPPPKI